MEATRRVAGGYIPDTNNYESKAVMRSHRSSLFLPWNNTFYRNLNTGVKLSDHNQINYSKARGKDEPQLTEMVSIEGDRSKAPALFARTPRSRPSILTYIPPPSWPSALAAPQRPFVAAHWSPPGGPAQFSYRLTPWHHLRPKIPS